MSTEHDEQHSAVKVFWAEIPPSEHLVQIYEEDSVVLDALEERLTAQGVDVGAARAREQYLPLDAEETLAQFMVSGWPDDDLFEHLVTNLLVRAHRNGQRAALRRPAASARLR